MYIGQVRRMVRVRAAKAPVKKPLLLTAAASAVTPLPADWPARARQAVPVKQRDRR